MTLMQIIFMVIAAATLISAVMVVSSRRMFNAALWLVLSLFGVALLFALLEASFFVVVQIIVYIGAIATLVIFAIMLTQRQKEAVEPAENRLWWVALLAAVGIFMVIGAALTQWSGFLTPASEMPQGGQNLAELGKVLVDPNHFMIPFEVASVMLLAAMIGAIFLAVEKKGVRG